MAIKDRITKTAASSATPQAPFRRPTGRASYPKRKTVDLSVEQNAWLDGVAYDGRVSAVGVIRAALDYLEANPDVLSEVIAKAHAAEHPEH